MYNQCKSTHLMADLTWQRALNPKWSGTFPKTAWAGKDRPFDSD